MSDDLAVVIQADDVSVAIDESGMDVVFEAVGLNDAIAAAASAAAAHASEVNAAASDASAALHDANAAASDASAALHDTNAAASAAAAHASEVSAAASAANAAAVLAGAGDMKKETYDPDNDGIIAIAQGGTGANDATTARTNLGLGNSATKDVGTDADTVAAGDDSRIVSALQPSDIGVTVLAPNGDGSALTGIATVPVGTTIYVNGTTAPSGFLKENGAILPRVGAYAKLWAYAQASGNLVSEAAWPSNRSAFSTGDGVGNFRIPDSRGVFVRGLDDGAGFDPGRTIGSYQDMMIQSHAHTVAYTPGNLAGGSGGNMIFGGGAEGSTSSVGGAETRPRNVAKLACIRYL